MNNTGIDHKPMVEPLAALDASIVSVTLILSPFVIFDGARLCGHSLLVIGFFVGCYGGYVLVGITATVTTEVSLLVAVVICLLSGIMGWLLLVKAYACSVVFTGACSGALLGNLVWVTMIARHATETALPYRVLLTIAMFLFGGFAAACFMRRVLVVLTPFLGAYIFVAGLDHCGATYLEWWSTSPFDPSSSGQIDANWNEAAIRNDKHVILLLVLWLSLFLAGTYRQARKMQTNNQKIRYQQACAVEHRSTDTRTGSNTIGQQQ
jgi:hypothetical protein